MDHPEEEMILIYDEKKTDYVIVKYEVDCAGVRRLSIEIRTVERIKPHLDNNKLYLKLRKDKKVTFEDDMPNMKNEMDHNLLIQTIEGKTPGIF